MDPASQSHGGSTSSSAGLDEFRRKLKALQAELERRKAGATGQTGTPTLGGLGADDLAKMKDADLKTAIDFILNFLQMASAFVDPFGNAPRSPGERFGAGGPPDSPHIADDSARAPALAPKRGRAQGAPAKGTTDRRSGGKRSSRARRKG